MQEWQDWIGFANESYANEQYEQAKDQYEKALSCALKHFESIVSIDPETALASVLVSYLNLADSYVRMNRAELAGMQYVCAERFLRNVFDERDAESNTRLAVLRAAVRVKDELKQFLLRYQAVLDRPGFQQCMDVTQRLDVMCDSRSIQ